MALIMAAANSAIVLAFASMPYGSKSKLLPLVDWVPCVAVECRPRIEYRSTVKKAFNCVYEAYTRS